MVMQMGFHLGIGFCDCCCCSCFCMGEEEKKVSDERLRKRMKKKIETG